VSQDLRSGILGSTNYISNRYHWSRFFHLSIPSDSSHPTWASTPSPNTAVCRCESRARSKGPARPVFSSALWSDLARHRLCWAHRLGAALTQTAIGILRASLSCHSCGVWSGQHSEKSPRRCRVCSLRTTEDLHVTITTKSVGDFGGTPRQ
jgi:hypothetical protein